MHVVCQSVCRACSVYRPCARVHTFRPAPRWVVSPLMGAGPYPRGRVLLSAAKHAALSGRGRLAGTVDRRKGLGWCPGPRWPAFRSKQAFLFRACATIVLCACAKSRKTVSVDGLHDTTHFENVLFILIMRPQLPPAYSAD